MTYLLPIASHSTVGYHVGMRTIQIKTDRLIKQIELNDSATADALWQVLPLKGRINRWGDELYFSIPVQVDLAADAREVLEVGDVTYWPPGQAFCIFWGPTPVSHGQEPRAAGPVNVLGKITTAPQDLGEIQDGEILYIEQIV